MAKYDDLEIDDELHKGLPDLTKEEYAQLEANILRDGKITDPIIAWGSVIVDGRNRWRIKKAHSIENYSVEYKQFVDNDEARDWIINRTLGRRNLSIEQRTLLLGELYINRKKASEIAQAQAGEEDTKTDKMSSSKNGKKRGKSKNGVAATVASENKVDEKTVKRAAEYFTATQKLCDPVRQAIVNREVKATQAQVKQLATMPEKAQMAAINTVKNGHAEKLKDVLPEKEKRQKGRRGGSKHLKFDDQELLDAFKVLSQGMDKRLGVYGDVKDAKTHHTAIMHGLRVARDHYDQWRKQSA